METTNWNKVENEACYVDETTGTQEFDHPEFRKLVEALDECEGIKYGVYRIAFKIFALQKQLRVPPLRLSSGVFARHQLSLSESSLSLDTAELEAVLADIYFAAEKEGHFVGNVDLTVDLMIKLLLNVYDKERQEPIRVLAAKTLLILLSEDPTADKWAALANCSADHNGCVSPKRLASLLSHVTTLVKYLGGNCEHIMQKDVDACFEKSAGMLGLTSHTVAEWGAHNCTSTQWLPVVQRITTSRQMASVTENCAKCTKPLVQMLKFQCNKCIDLYFCEKCYLYDKDLTFSGHKKTHLIQEIIDGQTNPAPCLSFIRGMTRFFFCTKTKKRKISKSKCKEPSRRRRDGKPAIFTSTVGKASGNKQNHPTCILQDIINQLETQNKVLQDLSAQLREATLPCDENLKAKVDTHWSHISTQISRLKTLKDNLSNHTTESTTAETGDRPQAFDLFSPILLEDKQSKVTESLKKPRVLSLDSGNLSLVSKNGDSGLVTVSGDASSPVVVQPTDSISAVSVNDISCWYNNESQATEKRPQQPLKADSKLIPPSKLKPSSHFAECEANICSVERSNVKMKEQNADLDAILDRLYQILAKNFVVDDSCIDNTQLRERAKEMEGLLGTLIRGVEQRATLKATQEHL